jgi:hypothetical protein
MVVERLEPYFCQPRGGRQKKEEISRQPLEPYFCRPRGGRRKKEERSRRPTLQALQYSGSKFGS